MQTTVTVVEQLCERRKKVEQTLNMYKRAPAKENRIDFKRLRAAAVEHLRVKRSSWETSARPQHGRPQ